ncbi:MAG TPA: bifunctional phosphoglucose/phosphomannose isomerase [Flavobacteriales bacterium]|nr:bifunctional phosphoglucose/phosphomannose isomerase [Flavobacteriales bacterium]HIN40284.1 bifunctional phosphoglucose/phosphomannose isomerase [Flavobacteriales bacterium]
MKALISSFSSHLKEALEIGNSANLASASNQINNVLISGLGGSGIGGTIASQLLEKEADIPINVNKDYFIPKYVNDKTLVIISSYSGNTEETLSAMSQAIKQNAEVVCITSGGEVLNIAKTRGLNHIIIPGGMPPRACLGYSLTQLFFVLNHYGIVGAEFKTQIKSGISLLESEEDDIMQKALELSGSMVGKTPIIYTSAAYEGVGIRLRQQLNENSKMLCWHQVFPEMNHNELVGWKSGDDSLAVLILRNKSDFSRTQKRIETCKEIFSKYTSTIIEVYSKGNSEIERTLYLIHLGDWLSWFLSEKNQVDAMEIEVINYLKSELSKI